MKKKLINKNIYFHQQISKTCSQTKLTNKAIQNSYYKKSGNILRQKFWLNILTGAISKLIIFFKNTLKNSEVNHTWKRTDFLSTKNDGVTSARTDIAKAALAFPL